MRFGGGFDRSDAARVQHGGSEAHFEQAMPDGVLFARSTQDVVDAVELCAAFRVPVIAYGAGTSLEGNTSPVHGGITIDLAQMDAVLAVHAEDFDCTVQAGCRREQLNHCLRDQGLFFPIDPGANATIGGMAATRASGTNAVRYGTMREAVLNLTVVMPDGKVIHTARRARKSAAGYDLTNLFVGSEGTLGIITEVTLRLHPIPETIVAAVCSFAELGGAVDTVVHAMQCGIPLARVELLDAEQVRAVNAWSKLNLAVLPTLFFEFHGSPASVDEQVQIVTDIAAGNGGGDFAWASLVEERTKLWKARHEAYYAAVNVRPGAVGLTTDVCVPISRLSECIAQTRTDLDAASIPATIVGHVGDGNFHVIFSIDPNSDSDMAEAQDLNERLVRRALSMEGTCTGEHGIGLGKRAWLVEELDEAVDVMKVIKRAFDPHDIMNPGKIFLSNGGTVRLSTNERAEVRTALSKG